MRMIKWDGMRGMEWKWIRVSVFEVVDRKNGMAFNGNECIENIDANENEKKRCVVMRVMQLKWDGKENGIMNRRVE